MNLALLNKVIQGIVQQKDERDLRRFFLENLACLIQYDMGIFDLCRVIGFTTELYDPIINSKFSPEFERRFIYEYDTGYAAKSYKKWLHREGKSIVYRDAELLTPSVKESKYYNDYLKRNGLAHGLNCEISHEGRNIALLTLYRGDTSEDFSEEDVLTLNLFLPHLTLTLSRLLPEDEKENIDLFLGKYDLTEREREIVHLVFNGYTNSEISKHLFLSVNTVKKHLNNIFQKMGVSSRNKLIKCLIDNRYDNILQE